MTEFIITKIKEEARATSEMPYEVRWKNGTLQQRWLIVEYSSDANFINRREEWRDVPMVEQ